jgi:hypothetical protein
MADTQRSDLAVVVEDLTQVEAEADQILQYAVAKRLVDEPMARRLRGLVQRIHAIMSEVASIDLSIRPPDGVADQPINGYRFALNHVTRPNQLIRVHLVPTEKTEAGALCGQPVGALYDTVPGHRPCNACITTFASQLLVTRTAQRRQ